MRIPKYALNTVYAYADCAALVPESERNLDFKDTGTLNSARLIKTFETAIPDGYNAFDADVVKALVRIVGKVPVKYRVAREGSVCIYIEGCTPSLAALLFQHNTRRILRTDEVSIEGGRMNTSPIRFGSKTTIRLWWD
jgi:hypothetical protein